MAKKILKAAGKKLRMLSSDDLAGSVGGDGRAGGPVSSGPYDHVSNPDPASSTPGNCTGDNSPRTKVGSTASNNRNQTLVRR